MRNQAQIQQTPQVTQSPEQCPPKKKKKKRITASVTAVINAVQVLWCLGCLKAQLSALLTVLGTLCPCPKQTQRMAAQHRNSCISVKTSN